MSFKIVDFLVFFLTIGVSFGIGIFFAVRERNRNTPANYFLAGRKSSAWPVALSFVVTFQSSLMILGFPAEVYAYGIGVAYYAVGITAAYIYAAFFIVPVFHPLKLTSVNEYFRLRYGNNSVRYLTLVAGMIYSLFYMATVIVGTCVALNVVLGIPFWGTILIYSTITTIYTSVGGMKAVIWTDVFQLIIMVTGIVAVLVKSTIGAGGVENMFEYAKDRINSSDFRIDPTIRYQFWSTCFGSLFSYFYVILMQPTMQRVYSTPTVKTARNLFFISTPFYATFMLMAALEGATIFAFYTAKRCDILRVGIIDNINAILPFAVLDLFQDLPGLAGLFTASLSSAALSTMSSCLSSLSAVTYEDIIKIKFPDIQDYKATKLSKLIVLMYGGVALGLAFGIALIPGSVIAIFDGFMGSIGGPIAATYLLSMFFRKATTKGIITGAVIGCLTGLWLNIGRTFSGLPQYPYLPSGPTDQCGIYEEFQYSNVSLASVYQVTNNLTSTSVTQQMMTTSNENLSFLETIYSTSFILIALIGTITSLIVGFIVSLCTSPPEHIDERCLFSFKHHFLRELCGYKPPGSALSTHEDGCKEEVTKFMTKDIE